MVMQKTNNERLQTIASAMQELNARLVYVGGAMAGAYATDPTATEPRTTLDVDCIVDSNSYAEYAAFEELLREKHFHNDHDSEPPVICRWVYNGELVDVMSMNEQSLSFGNRWYRIMYNGHRLTAEDFNHEHERCLQFIKKTVADSQAKTKIVLTHHVPTHLCTAEEFRGSTIGGAFTVELGDYIADSGIDYWIYGHSHRNIDAQIGTTRLMSNQFGYLSHGEPIHNGFNLARHITL